MNLQIYNKISNLKFVEKIEAPNLTKLYCTLVLPNKGIYCTGRHSYVFWFQ